MDTPLDLTRAYCKVCHSKAAYDHNGCAAPCNTCGALHQYYLPVPTLPGMNMTERAARAEALAERLAQQLYSLANQTEAGMLPTGAYAAVEAWETHKADLETLGGR